MDESGYAINVEQKSKIILPANEKAAFAKQDRNKEWTTLIEDINVIGQNVSPFLIFKGKSMLKDLCELIGTSDATLAVLVKMIGPVMNLQWNG